MKNRMRVLITGHSGMLGKDISNIFKHKGASVYGYDICKNPEFDNHKQFISDLKDNELLQNALDVCNPNLIIYSAAIVDLELCEFNHELAEIVHIRAAEFLAKQKNVNAKLYYISTDSVFDGNKGNYSEHDHVSPLNYYSWSKYEGEKKVLEYPNTTVIRTNIYGFSNPMKNSLSEWAIKKLTKKEPIIGFEDIVFNAMYTKDLAKILFDLNSFDTEGILNIACEGKWTKFEFLSTLACILGLDKTLIKKGKSSINELKIKRPLKTNLDISKINTFLKMPTLEESVINFCSNIKNQIYEIR